MAKRKMTAKRDYVAMAFRIDSAPRDWRRREVLQAIRDAVADKTSLPPELSVTWLWRNDREHELGGESITGNTTQGPLDKVIRESRAGFHTLMLRRLDREIAKLPTTETELVDPSRERRAAALKGWVTRRQAVRRNAAYKGWRTRRARAAKRRAAALKGWETRRAKGRK